LKTLRWLALLLVAPVGPALAFGVQGTVTKTGGAPVYPCDIDIFDRQTGLPVIVTSDSTLPNGSYTLTLPNGRYNLLFKPDPGTHAFDGEFLDARVQSNTVTANVTLLTGVHVQGCVRGLDGLGVAGANIRFRDDAGNAPINVQGSTSQADGTFATLVDAATTWNVEIIPPLASHRAPVELPAVPLGADVDLGDVIVPTGALFTCTVTDQNLFPVGSAKITARALPGRSKVFTPNNGTSASGLVQIVLPLGAYDVIAEPPAAQVTTLATLTQYGVVAGADVTLPNFALPPGRQLSAKVVGAPGLVNIVGADIDVDWMQPPTYPRVQTANDVTNALGNFSVTVGQGAYRVTVNPPVPTRCLPVRLNDVAVGSSNVNLGTVVCPAGHWLDVTVIRGDNGLPVAGANIDLDDLETGSKLITIDDVTNASGFARIVSDQRYYQLRVIPPDASLDTAVVVGGLRTLSDTALTVVMYPAGVLAVDGPAAPALRLATPWPNPARAGVRLAFSGRGDGELDILDLAGRRVTTAWRGALAGEATAAWDGRDDTGRRVPDGVYFARLRIGGERSVRRVVVTH